MPKKSQQNHSSKKRRPCVFYSPKQPHKFLTMPNSDDFRVKRIHQLLLEMARGNFFYSLEPEEKNDNIASLVVMLNMVNEELRDSFIHQGFTNAHHTPQYMIQLSLLLDSNGRIEMVTNNSCSLLKCLPNDLIGKPITDILSKPSQKKWNQKLPKLSKKEYHETVLKLEFVSSKGLLLTKDCNITVFQNLNTKESKILLDTVFFSKGEPFPKEKAAKKLMVTKGTKDHKVRLSPKDIQIMRDVHDMIINNLENDLPRLKDLALQMGTNEYKLKYGFKQMYGITVFRFLTQERLRQAKTLILHSQHSLKQIARMTGFKSITHFSRAFKEKYGLPPSQARR